MPITYCSTVSKLKTYYITAISKQNISINIIGKQSTVTHGSATVNMRSVT